MDWDWIVLAIVAVVGGSLGAYAIVDQRREERRSRVRQERQERQQRKRPGKVRR